MELFGKVIHNTYLAILILFCSIAIFCLTLFNYELSKTSNDRAKIEVIVKPGTIDSIATTLYDKGLIKNKFAFKLYIKLTGKSNLKAATYNLSKNMGVRKIVKILSDGKGEDSNKIKITFKEGYNIRNIAKIISSDTNITEDEFYEKLNNEEYLKSLISKYWFLTDDILKSGIYYSLEGYLYPNTYYFSSKDIKPEDIINTMLEETNRQLTPYKDKIENNKMSINNLMTMASIVELEGVTLNDRKGIVGVFNNRLEAGMNLGSDVTTYYAAKINMGDRDLYSNELNDCNNYNTRCPSFTKLPIAPICNPEINSIIAVLEPEDNNYYYFVADKNRKIYFSKNITEHNNIIRKLKNEGLWYEY